MCCLLRCLALTWRFVRNEARRLPPSSASAPSSHSSSRSPHITVNRISLVKPDKARVVENRIIQMAKSGALKGEQVSDKRLTDLLANMADAGTTGATKVVMKRRTYDDSDDDDDDDDL